MMSIVVYDLYIVRGLAENIETSLYTVEVFESPDHAVNIDTQDMPACKSRQRIQHIVFSRYRQRYAAQLLPSMVDCESRHAFIVKVYVRCKIVAAFAESERYGIRKSFDHALYKRVCVICDDRSVRRHEFRELVKRACYMLDILEIVEMV